MAPASSSIYCATCGHHPDAHYRDREECLRGSCGCRAFVKSEPTDEAGDDERMTSHVHDPEAFVTDEGHVHESCRRCGREWHLGTLRDPWEVLDECPQPTEH